MSMGSKSDELRNPPVSAPATGQGQQAPQVGSRMAWMRALSSVHVGNGESNGFIDNAIFREGALGWPCIPGSSLKGVYSREKNASHETRMRMDREDKLVKLFGAATDEDGHADSARKGKLNLTDAKLLCFPVRSLYGTFAWCTCPYALIRLLEDMEGWTPPSDVAKPSDVPNHRNDDTIRTDRDSSLSLGRTGPVFLEERQFAIANADDVEQTKLFSEWRNLIRDCVFPAGSPVANAFRNLFDHQFAIVSDDVFAFMAEYRTEVVARIRIDSDSKTADDQGLWYEENLPAQSILSSIATMETGSEHLWANVDSPGTAVSLQIGGNATTGRGRIKMKFN